MSSVIKAVFQGAVPFCDGFEAVGIYNTGERGIRKKDLGIFFLCCFPDFFFIHRNENNVQPCSENFLNCFNDGGNGLSEVFVIMKTLDSDPYIPVCIFVGLSFD